MEGLSIMELGGEGLNCMDQEEEELDHTGREV